MVWFGTSKTKKVVHEPFFFAISPYLRPYRYLQQQVQRPSHESAFVGYDVGLKCHDWLQGLLNAVGADARANLGNANAVNGFFEVDWHIHLTEA
jgi:hypothetical protein